MSPAGQRSSLPEEPMEERVMAYAIPTLAEPGRCT
jgi:hypothetical protein